jgi:DNA mismatch endonuclease (patch repair protein)
MGAVSRETRSRMMSAVKSKGNASTEVAMVSAFRKAGLKGWRRHSKLLGFRPDFVFGRERVVVFLDGCFWHGCPIHGSFPESNKDFWASKLEANVARDRRADAYLLGSGWTVIRFWEHSIKSDSGGCASMLRDLLEFGRNIRDT